LVKDQKNLMLLILRKDEWIKLFFHSF
jgi:hypothetical protein